MEASDGAAVKVEPDPEAAAVYVRLSGRPVARTRTVRGSQSDAAIDYAADGSVVGVELLGVSQGIDLRGVPEPKEVERLLHGLGLRVQAAAKARAG